MKKYSILFIALGLISWVFGQKESNLNPELEKVTMFFSGAQLQHSAKGQLKAGRQTVVLEKLTDYLDPNSIQVKAEGKVTILSVGLRKNFEDKRISNQEIQELNTKIKALEKEEKALRSEQQILQIDRAVLNQNSSLKGEQTGVKVAELKEAYTFIHARMSEISKREAEILESIEKIIREKNKLAQEIDVQRSKPVINYSEVLVELDVLETTNARFTLTYMTPNASWEPYYDMRSNGVGSPVVLEAKAHVKQQTGINWKDIDLVLSTNDPYQNAQERELLPWKLNYNEVPYVVDPAPAVSRPVFDYTGQKIRGEVIDASTGESMPFTKIYFTQQPSLSVMSDALGKFEITVPQGGTQLTANFAGYQQASLKVNAPYLKFFLIPNGVSFEQVKWANPNMAVTINEQRLNASASYAPMANGAMTYNYSVDDKQLEAVQITSRGRKKSKQRSKNEEEEYDQAQYVSVTEVQRDLRVEYEIQSKFSVPCDGSDQRVAIAQYELPANYEYHTAPKIDPGVYLVAQVSGWEKLNLLNGESNIYFDGTYIGKSYVDAQSTRDTLSFSMGKDSKMQIERKRVAEKSKNRSIGSRQRYEVAWEIKIRNNGSAEIPVVIKDQFPVSVNNDIKVKNGDYAEGKLNEKTGIISWTIKLPKAQSKTLDFNYAVEYSRGMIIYLE